MDKERRKRIKAHQDMITGITFQEVLRNTERLFNRIREEIDNIDEPSWKKIPHALRVTQDTKKYLRDGFEYLEQLYQKEGLLSDKYVWDPVKRRTLDLLDRFEVDLRDWYELEYEDKGIDLTGQLQEYERLLKELQRVFRNQKLAIDYEIEEETLGRESNL